MRDVRESRYFISTAQKCIAREDTVFAPMQDCTEPRHPPLREISHSHSGVAEDSKLLNLRVKR
jgi:hypothetical protein